MRERGGCIFRTPRGRNFIPPPLLYTPPTPRRVVSGVGVCIKFGLPKNILAVPFLPYPLGSLQRSEFPPCAVSLCNPKYDCRVTATVCFACIALVAWKHWFDSTLRKLSVHPKVQLKWYGFRGVPSHSSHCSGGLPQCSVGSPVSAMMEDQRKSDI